MTTEKKMAALLKAKNDDEIRTVIEKLTDLQKNAVMAIHEIAGKILRDCELIR